MFHSFKIWLLGQQEETPNWILPSVSQKDINQVFPLLQNTVGE